MKTFSLRRLIESLLILAYAGLSEKKIGFYVKMKDGSVIHTQKAEIFENGKGEVAVVLTEGE